MDKQCGNCNWNHAKYEYKCERCVTHSNWEQDSEPDLKHTDTDLQEFAEWIGERYFFEEVTGIWYLYNKIPTRDPVPMFTTPQLLEEFKVWKEEQK